MARLPQTITEFMIGWLPCLIDRSVKKRGRFAILIALMKYCTGDLITCGQQNQSLNNNNASIFLENSKIL